MHSICLYHTLNHLREGVELGSAISRDSTKIGRYDVVLLPRIGIPEFPFHCTSVVLAFSVSAEMRIDSFTF